MGGLAKQSNATKNIGLRVKKIRTNDKKTSAEFASAYGVSRATWSLMENGKTAFSTDDIFKLAKFLGVSPAWLLTGEGEMESQKGECDG